jgi:hypothetical protein
MFHSLYDHIKNDPTRIETHLSLLCITDYNVINAC